MIAPTLDRHTYLQRLAQDEDAARRFPTRYGAPRVVARIDTPTPGATSVLVDAGHFRIATSSAIRAYCGGEEIATDDDGYCEITEPRMSPRQRAASNGRIIVELRYRAGCHLIECVPGE